MKKRTISIVWFPRSSCTIFIVKRDGSVGTEMVGKEPDQSEVYSLDLPVEVWIGQPTCDSIFAESRLESANKKTYIFLSLAMREGTPKDGNRLLSSIAEWAKENGSSEYWTEFISVLEGCTDPPSTPKAFCVGSSGRSSTHRKANTYSHSPVFVREVRPVHDDEPARTWQRTPKAHINRKSRPMNSYGRRSKRLQFSSLVARSAQVTYK